MFAPANTAQFDLLIPAVRHDFKVLAFRGAEVISSLYAIHIELVSERPDVDLESLLSQPAFLQFGLNGEGLHGCIEDVWVGDAGPRLTRYHLTLVPALHYLQFSHQQRIFQQLTVAQIIAQVLKGHGILADAYTFHVSSSTPREYCTQYGESDFQFVQRLCSEEGIAWHHQHSPQGHHLVFTDDQTFFPTLGTTPYQQGSGQVADHPVVRHFSQRFSTRTSQVTRRDYDFQRPSLLLESQFSAEFTPALEDYRSPLLIDSERRGRQLARQALERHRADYQLAEGKSDQPNLRSGHFFTLSEHPRSSCNALWLLLGVKHEGKQPQVLEESISSDIKPEDGLTQGYRNSFSAIPWDVFYRPPLVTRPSLLVSQTARVTGPAGEEIYCDEYGRVKVEFHWDRSERGSDKSSCWLRVSSSWAGESFGAVTIPRIGMEVVVTYLEGNPDDPLITGCMSNKVMPVPYPLPANKTRTVLRSDSSPRNGGYNELSIEDRAGQEQIYLRAQRDLKQLILNDSDTEIGQDRHEQITQDSRSLIGRDRFEQVDNHSSSLIQGNEQHTTHGERNTLIGGNELISITGNSSITAGGTLVIQAGSQAHVTATNVVIDAGMSLTLAAGGQHIVINSGGIFSSVDIVQGGSPMSGIPVHLSAPVGDLLFGETSASTSTLVAKADEPVVEEEEEEEELEETVEEPLVGITLRVGVFFDGTLNNANNGALGLLCGASHPIKPEDLDATCKPYMSDRDSSYANDESNIKKLSDLYFASDEIQDSGEQLQFFQRLYVEGIGTSSGQADSLMGAGVGRGASGVSAKVEDAFQKITVIISQFAKINPDTKIVNLTFDTFGFSRGAAAARHFANEVALGHQGPLGQTIKIAHRTFHETFSGDYQRDIEMGFIGLFDTVASVGGVENLGYIRSQKAPGIKLYLPRSLFPNVVQLAARDEIRANFPLTRVKAEHPEYTLPGVHSDIGGGYFTESEELLLISPMQALDVPVTTDVKYTSIYRDAQQAKAQWEAKGWPAEMLEVVTPYVRGLRPSEQDRMNPYKRVYAALQLKRPVRGELSRVYLRVMYALAQQQGVRFEPLNEQASRYLIPAELKLLSDRFVAGDYSTTPEEEHLLKLRYIHTSANWNPPTILRGSVPRTSAGLLYFNAPTTDGTRLQHPHVPD